MVEEMEIDDSLYRYEEDNKKLIHLLVCVQSPALYAWRQCNEKNGSF